MQQAIADSAAKAAKIATIPAGVVTSVDRPTARQARLYRDPAFWRGMASVRRQVADEDREAGHVPMADRNDYIAGFYETVSRLPRVPGPAERDLAPEPDLPALPAPAGEKEGETRQLSAPQPIPVVRDGRGLAGLLAAFVRLVRGALGRRAPQQRA